LNEAKEIFETILGEFKILKDNLNISSTLVNLAKINHELNKDELSEEQFKEAISLANEVSGMYDQCNSTREYAKFLIANNRYDEAISYGENAYKIAANTSSLELKANCSQTLADAYSKSGNYQKAYQYQFEHDALADSLFNQETLSAANGQKFEIDYLTKVATDSVKNAEAQKVKDAELFASKEESKRLQVQADQEKQQKIFLFIGLGLALAFGFIMFNRFKVTNKQKQIIEVQKKETEEKNTIIEEQHKEISDSINYAEMIQQSVLPQIKIQDITPEAFVLMKPKDKVSGDFFWLENNEDRSYFAVADCTGHGIPGAFISMIGTIILNEIYNSKNLVFPNEILDELNRLIKITLTNKDGNTMKDGMDICFTMLNKATNELYFSGANNPLWIISPSQALNCNGQNISPNISDNELNLFEVKADKQPVGKYDDNTAPFSLNKIQLNVGDCFYLFTDGYADQFGGPKGKKLMYKPFKRMLLNLQNSSITKHEQELLNNFNSWKGKLDQIDDVCIAGVKIAKKA
jgi:serine phosphatase RsbU (regulator of sigma subunit)